MKTKWIAIIAMGILVIFSAFRRETMHVNVCTRIGTHSPSHLIRAPTRTKPIRLIQASDKHWKTRSIRRFTAMPAAVGPQTIQYPVI